MIIFYFSYDTEVLNQSIHLHNMLENCSFINSFKNKSHQKIIAGVQKLYLIGK